jgi:hypothetical protein
MPTQSILRTILLAFSLSLATTGALAEGVYIASAPHLGPIGGIQSAVNLAVEGDTLIVAGGYYEGFAIDGKSLIVVVAPNANAIVQGTVRIENIGVGQAVLLRGLEVMIPEQPIWKSPMRALEAVSCAGDVRLEDCKLTGVSWPLEVTNGSIYPSGSDGARFQSCARVVLSQCMFLGGAGGGSSSNCCSFGGDGGMGLRGVQSHFVLQECTAIGGKGGPNGTKGGNGGAGARIEGGSLYAASSAFTGSNGGLAHDFLCPVLGGNGGNGILATQGTEVELQACVLVAGLGGHSVCGNHGSPGAQFGGGGSLEQITPPGRSLRATSLAADDGVLNIEVRGAPGDRVWLVSSSRPDWVQMPMLKSPWLVPFPVHITFAPQGIIPSSGILSFSHPAPALTTPTSLRVLQAMVRDTQGRTFLTGARHALILDRTAAPDCNSNGANDWLDILEGFAHDCQHNLVPDSCEPDCNGDGMPDCSRGTLLRVDPASAPGGNGTTCAPFDNLAAAVLAAPPGSTLLLRDGVYTGPGNREVLLGEKTLTLRPENLPGAVVIDLSGAGRALRVHSPEILSIAENPKVRIESLTFVNGSVTDGGGAIDARYANLEIANCVFENCSAQFGGGAVNYLHSNMDLRGCTFRENRSLSSLPGQGLGGAVLFQFDESGSMGADLPVVEDCLFSGNEASSGGALASFQPLQTKLNRCAFIDNEALVDGGALYLFGKFVAYPLANCLFAGNRAAWRGGAVFARSVNEGSLGVNFYGNTFTHNQAGSSGGALYLSSDVHVPEFPKHFFNCILWHNFAPTGPQITLSTTISGGGTALKVANSDVMNGQAGIAVLAGSLQWDVSSLDVDPLFADPDGPDNNVLTFLDNNYRPVGGSPVNDAGYNSFANTIGNLDLDKGPRQVDDPAAPNTGNGTSPIVDMGAYEFP